MESTEPARSNVLMVLKEPSPNWERGISLGRCASNTVGAELVAETITTGIQQAQVSFIGRRLGVGIKGDREPEDHHPVTRKMLYR